MYISIIDPWWKKLKEYFGCSKGTHKCTKINLINGMGMIPKFRIIRNITSRHVNWLISLFLTAISFTLFLIVNPFPHYKSRLSVLNNAPAQYRNDAFFDLDNDGLSERLILKDYHNFPAIEINGPDDKFIDVITISGIWLNYNLDYLVCDTDQDGFNEIFTITIKNDTLLLNGFEPMGDDKHFLEDEFIDITPKIDGKNNITVEQIFADDTDFDGKPEISFILTAGYTLYPRKVYLFHRDTRSMIRTPHLGAKPNQCMFLDSNGDGLKELFLSTTATENFPGDSTVPFNDYSAYILGFNHSLDSLLFLKEFDSEKHVLTCRARMENSGPVIYVLDYASKTNRNRLIKYSMNGELLRATDLEGQGVFRFLFPDQEGSTAFYIGNRGSVFSADTALSLVRAMEEPYLRVITHFDANEVFGEDLKFWLGETKLLISDNRLNPYAILTVELSEIFHYALYFLGKDKNAGVRLAGQDSSGVLTYFQVQENHFYPFRRVIAFLLFIALFLFFSLMLRIQSYYAQRRLKNEMQLQSLQLRYVQNQLHPHFTFNVLNNIGALIRSGKNELGYRYLNKFSGMLRVVLLKSDTHSWKIADEIDFIHSYLAIENLRFNNKFSYNIHVPEEEITGRFVPKLMVQAFVENSIRHGLMHKTGDCMLEVWLADMDHCTEIVIEDNGIGREASAAISRESTGKGIMILSDFIAVYNRIHSDEFSMEITDLYTNPGDAAGTRVRLLIPKNYQ